MEYEEKEGKIRIASGMKGEQGKCREKKGNLRSSRGVAM